MLLQACSDPRGTYAQPQDGHPNAPTSKWKPFNIKTTPRLGFQHQDNAQTACRAATDMARVQRSGGEKGNMDSHALMAKKENWAGRAWKKPSHAPAPPLSRNRSTETAIVHNMHGSSKRRAAVPSHGMCKQARKNRLSFESNTAGFGIEWWLVPTKAGGSEISAAIRPPDS